MLDITKKQKKISYIAGSITSFLIAFKMHYAEDVGILFNFFLHFCYRNQKRHWVEPFSVHIPMPFAQHIR